MATGYVAGLGINYEDSRARTDAFLNGARGVFSPEMVNRALEQRYIDGV